jgi:hypothetical protein
LHRLADQSLILSENRMKIKKLPNILALHLKRFKYQEQLQKYIKLTYRVVFPFELRLFNTVSNNFKYSGCTSSTQNSTLTKRYLTYYGIFSAMIPRIPINCMNFGHVSSILAGKLQTPSIPLLAKDNNLTH